MTLVTTVHIPGGKYAYARHVEVPATVTGARRWIAVGDSFTAGTVVDAHGILADPALWADDLHPNSDGHRELAEAAARLLGEALNNASRPEGAPGPRP